MVNQIKYPKECQETHPAKPFLNWNDLSPAIYAFHHIEFPLSIITCPVLDATDMHLLKLITPHSLSENKCPLGLKEHYAAWHSLPWLQYRKQQ